MPANLGMIALGKAKTLEKRLIKLEEAVEEIKKEIQVRYSEPVRGEHVHEPSESSEGVRL